LNSLRSIHWHGIRQPQRLPNRNELASNSRAKLKISTRYFISLISKRFHGKKKQDCGIQLPRLEDCKNIRHPQTGAESALIWKKENASQDQLTGIAWVRVLHACFIKPQADPAPEP
jgi:hypothetical protein